MYFTSRLFLLNALIAIRDEESDIGGLGENEFIRLLARRTDFYIVLEPTMEEFLQLMIVRYQGMQNQQIIDKIEVVFLATIFAN